MKLFKLAAKEAFDAGDYSLAARIICDHMCSRYPEVPAIFEITYDAPQLLKIVLCKERHTYCFDARSLEFEWWKWDGPAYSDRIIIE